MTGLSVTDVKMMGPQIGFYPDSSESVGKLIIAVNGGAAASGFSGPQTFRERTGTAASAGAASGAVAVENVD
jgi:hypothetical protein